MSNFPEIGFCLPLLIPLVLNASDLQEVVSVEAVNLFTAYDGGDYIKDLQATELTILENGLPQRILGVSNLALSPADNRSGKDVPLSLVFCN